MANCVAASLRLYPWYFLENIEPFKFQANFDPSRKFISTPEIQVENLTSTCGWLKEKKKILSVGLNINLPTSEDLKLYDEVWEKLNETKTKNQSATTLAFCLSLLMKSDLIQWVNKFEEVLSEAVCKRVKNHPNLCKKCFKNITNNTEKCHHAKVAVLFSGGLDCTVLSLLADR